MPDFLPTQPMALLAIAGCAVAVLVVFVVLIRLMTRGSGKKSTTHDDLSIDLMALDAAGPPEDGPQLQYYSTPVRLVAFVLAPAGRGTTFPSQFMLREVADRLVPGLASILDWHQPVFRQWPEQLSSQGFAQSFFTNLQLPGDQGKSTPWCGVAGRFDSGNGMLLAGLVCRAESANGLSQVIIQQEGQWHDVLRVKDANQS